jgi:hypothetical protein
MKSRAPGHLPVATAILVWMSGCGDATIPGAGPTPSNAAPGGSVSPAPTARPVSIRGFTHAGDGSILPGVEVCLDNGVLRSPPTDPVMCTVSASDGSFRVSGASANGAATLTFRKDGFESTVRPMELQAEDVTLPSSENVLLADPLVFVGTPADPSKGQIAFAVSTTGAGPTPQVSATLFDFIQGGASGLAWPPVYVDEKGAPAPGTAAGTAGGFVNVAPSLYIVTFHATSGFCVPDSGLHDYAATQDSNGDIAMLVPIIQGYVTAPVGVSCTSDGP